MESTPLEILEEKLQQLLKRYKQLQKEHAMLKDALYVSDKKLAIAQKEVAMLQEKLDVQSLNNIHRTEEDKKKLEARINAYLKEIDTCINLLHHT